MKLRIKKEYLEFFVVIASLLWAPRGFWGSDAKFMVLVLDIGIIGLFLLAIFSRGFSCWTQVILLILIVYMSARGIDSNLPSTEVAYLGFRKSVLFLLALYIGYTLKGIDIYRLSVILVVIGGGMLFIAGKQFYSWTDFDDRLLDTLSAGIDTHQIFGMKRAIGLFSSPFTLGMFGAIVLSLVFIFKSRVAVVIVLVIGSGLIFFSVTRINFIAGMFALMMGYFFSRFDSSKALKLCVVGICFLSVLWVYTDEIGFSILANIDDRLLGRLASWQHAGEAFSANAGRFFFGFGLGSAGDALGLEFTQGWHITPHNIFLKYMFEGGVIGLVLLVVGLWSLSKSMFGAPPDARATGLALVAVILVNGVSGGTVDAAPTVDFAAILIGRIAAIGGIER